jgi:hypothetical protein
MGADQKTGSIQHSAFSRDLVVEKASTRSLRPMPALKSARGRFTAVGMTMVWMGSDGVNGRGVQGWVWNWQTKKASRSECPLLMLEPDLLLHAHALLQSVL